MARNGQPSRAMGAGRVALLELRFQTLRHLDEPPRVFEIQFVLGFEDFVSLRLAVGQDDVFLLAGAVAPAAPSAALLL